MVQVSQIYIYPIKSMKGISLNHSKVWFSGLKYDRQFMVSKLDGSFITARQYPQLLKLKTILNQKGLSIELDGNHLIQVNINDFSKSNEPTEVWGNHFTSHIGAIVVNRFLSEFLQEEVQLRWVGSHLTRRVKRYPKIPLGFADGYPFLLINQASFDYVQKLCPKSLDIRQFRGNIIIDNALPFAEDGWKTIKIGEVVFDLVKPCSRCVMTTINSDSSQFIANNEPLTTLRNFRQDELGEIDFGMNMIARHQGVIKIGDKVEILEKQSAKKYIITHPKTKTAQSEQCLIHVGEQIIQGNNQQTVLEQLEQNNIAIPYSCRVGICGRCTVTLEEGTVIPMTQSAIKSNRQILTCSCVPKTDIKLNIHPKKE